MSRRLQPIRPQPSRLPRAWARLGLLGAAGAGLAALAVAVLVERDEPATPPRVHVTPTPPSGPAPVAPTVAPAPLPAIVPPRVRPAPRTLGEALAQDATITSPELATWVADAKLSPQVRYGALRRLEQDDPRAAVSAALGVLTDVTPLVRLNAIALLSRSDDPRAKAALEQLDARSRALADRLARR